MCKCIKGQKWFTAGHVWRTTLQRTASFGCRARHGVDLFCSSFQVVTIKLCCVAVDITTFATAVFFQRRIKLCTPPYFGIRQLGRTSIAAMVATGVRKAFLLSPFPTSDSPTCCCCCCCCCTLSLLNASFAFGSSLYLLPLVVRVLPFRLGHATR